MQDLKQNRKFPLSSSALIITAVLVAQWGMYAKFSKTEKVPVAKELALFPNQLDGWFKTQEGFVDRETQAILQADDTLTRTYANAQFHTGASLFIASFRSLRTGAAPHSPKNCLPGNGWTQVRDDRVSISLPDRTVPIEVNRYVIQRGNARSLVLYWYQSRDRAVASEYTAKFYSMRDAVIENRTDTALVRVIIALQPGEDEEKVQKAAENFVRSFYQPLIKFLPS